MTPELVVRGALKEGQRVDLLVAKGKILALEPADDRKNYDSAKLFSADELVLLPALIDLHAHLREPGQEYKETIASGLEAAAHGGFGRVCCMANTRPVNDNGPITLFMLAQAAKARPKGPFLHPIGALTKGLEGKELAPMIELAEAGAVAFSNDGLPVADNELFRRAVEYASTIGKVVIDHCEDPWLARGGVMNEGVLSGRLGLKGIPTAAESLQVARDLLIASLTDAPIHLAHISCRESVEFIEFAKRKGIRVTAETCPHYLVYDESACEGYNTAAKVNPPLRTPDDVQAMREALASGVIDFLATDHAPHAEHEKEHPFEEAPNGISGFDTALAQTYALVAQGVLTERRLAQAWHDGPADLLGFPKNSFSPGDPADFLLFDPGLEWLVTPEALRSKGKNTPAMGTSLSGKVKALFLQGRQIV